MKMWNPWWAEGKVPASKKRISRPQTLKTILKLLDIREVVCITGVTRCGKSTVMYQAIDYLIGKGVKPEKYHFNLKAATPGKNIDEVKKSPRGKLIDKAKLISPAKCFFSSCKRSRVKKKIYSGLRCI